MLTYSRKRKSGDQLEKLTEQQTRLQDQQNNLKHITSSTVVGDPNDPYFFDPDSDDKQIQTQTEVRRPLQTASPSKQPRRANQKSPSSTPQKQQEKTQQCSAVEKAVSPLKEKKPRTKLFYQRRRDGEKQVKKSETAIKQKQNGKTDVKIKIQQKQQQNQKNKNMNKQCNVETGTSGDTQNQIKEGDSAKIQSKDSETDSGVQDVVARKQKQHQELMGLLGMLCPSGISIQRRSQTKLTNEMEANQKGMEQQYMDDILYSLDGLKIVGSNLKSICSHIIGILKVISHTTGRGIVTREQLWQQIVDTLADQLDDKRQGYQVICVGAAWLMLFLAQENIQSRLFRCSNMRKLMIGILKAASMSESIKQKEMSSVQEIVDSLQESGVRTIVPQDLLKDGLAIMNSALVEVSHPSQPPAFKKQLQLVLGQAKLLKILAVDMCRWMGKFEKAFEKNKNSRQSESTEQPELSASQQREKMQHVQNIMFMLNKYGYLLSQMVDMNEDNARSLCSFRVTCTSNFPRLLVRCFGGVVNCDGLRGSEKWKELMYSFLGLLMNLTQDEDVATQKDLMDSRIVEFSFDLLTYLCGCKEEEDDNQIDIVNWNKIVEVKELLICLLALMINLVDTKIENRQVFLKEQRQGMVLRILCELVWEGQDCQKRRSSVSSDRDATEVTFEQLDRSHMQQHKKMFARYASVLLGFLLLDEEEVQISVKKHLINFAPIENNIRSCQQHFAGSKMQSEYLQLLLKLAQQVHDMT